MAGHAPTRAHSGVEQVWLALLEQWALEPESVRQIYSQWEPSEGDRAFLKTWFTADMVLSWTFARPTDQSEAGWRQALEEVAAALAQTEPRRSWWRFWE